VLVGDDDSGTAPRCWTCGRPAWRGAPVSLSEQEARYVRWRRADIDLATVW